MYRVFLALFLILTIFSSFAGKKTEASSAKATATTTTSNKRTTDPRVGRPDPKNPSQNEFKDEVVRGESAVEHRAQATPGSRRELNKGPGVTTGVSCTTTEGVTVNPKDKLYKKCVDTANRIK